jgi:hypothetical protein
MPRFRALLLCALICSCHRQATVQERRETDPKKLAELRKAFVPEAYLRREDQERARRLRDGYSAPMPCEHEAIEGGVRVIAATQVDQCFKMTAPQRWQGLWRNNFEGSEFCEAPAKRCPGGDNRDFVELSIRSPLRGARDTPPGGLYAIDFIGRKTLYPGVYDGGAPEEIIADRLISIRLVEPPPPGQMTKAHIEGYRKDCAGKPICMPNLEISRKK